MSPSRRQFLATAIAVPAAVVLTPTLADAKPRDRLTNLAHLDFLLDDVPLAALPTHTTYRLAAEPTARAPWTYADARPDGFARVGGGTLDPATGHWSQGAYNTDDIARAAVVYLRHWRSSGAATSRESAYQLLRTLTWLQNDSGPDAGRPVLWLQPDGALNPSAIPVELPDPSDSAESYWLARTVWALGEGYAAFRDRDRAFARFLWDRLGLALDALERGSLGRYGQWVVSDGVRLPAWLITGGADATAEAMLGLVAAARARPQDARVARALDRYGEGVAAMATPAGPAWPFGAVLPWTGALGFWHAWGGAAPEALARAGKERHRKRWVAAAVADAASFTPQVLATGGPHNAWAPVPAEAQIAYGAHGRVAGALAAAQAGGGKGLREIAGLAAAWFFGANTAGVPAYDPATGVTVDGIETDGRVNRNSGAESTIHGLLTMLALDDAADVAALARSITGPATCAGLVTLPASGFGLAGGATLVTAPGGAWTGEGNLVNGQFAQVPAGGSVTVTLDAPAGSRVLPLVWRDAGDTGTATWTLSGRPLGTTANGGTGPRGLTEAEGSLIPQLLDGALPGGPVTLTATSTGTMRLSAVLVLPPVSTASYSARGGRTVLYASTAARLTNTPALAKGSGMAYTADGTPRGRQRAGATVAVQPGGFTVTTP